MSKLFVWDLHGTLEYGNHYAVLDISNMVLEQAGFPERFAESDAVRLYGRRWFEYFRWILPHENETCWLELQDTCFRLSTERADIQARRMRLTDHAEEVLSAIGARHEQVLISTTRPANLAVFVEQLGLATFFCSNRQFAVDGHSRSAPRTKREALAAILARERRRIDSVVIVGDSASDMKLAEVAGGTRYLYRHPEFPARRCDADYVIDDLRQVLAQV